MLSSFSCVEFFASLCTIALQAPLSMGILQSRILESVAMPFSRESSKPGIEPACLTSLAFQVSSLLVAPPGKPRVWFTTVLNTMYYY